MFASNGALQNYNGSKSQCVMLRFFMSVQFRMDSRVLTFPNILNQSAIKNFLDALIQEVAVYLFLAFCRYRILPLWVTKCFHGLKYSVACFASKYQFHVCQNLNFEVKVHEVLDSINIFFFSLFKVRDVSYRPPGTEMSLLKSVNFSLPEKRYFVSVLLNTVQNTLFDVWDLPFNCFSRTFLGKVSF